MLPEKNRVSSAKQEEPSWRFSDGKLAWQRT